MREGGGLAVQGYSAGSCGHVHVHASTRVVPLRHGAGRPAGRPPAARAHLAAAGSWDEEGREDRRVDSQQIEDCNKDLQTTTTASLMLRQSTKDGGHQPPARAPTTHAPRQSVQGGHMPACPHPGGAQHGLACPLHLHPRSLPKRPALAQPRMPMTAKLSAVTPLTWLAW